MAYSPRSSKTPKKSTLSPKRTRSPSMSRISTTSMHLLNSRVVRPKHICFVVKAGGNSLRVLSGHLILLSWIQVSQNWSWKMFEISSTARSGTLNEVSPFAADICLCVSMHCFASCLFTTSIVRCARIWQDVSHSQHRWRAQSERLHHLALPLRTGRHESLRAHIGPPRTLHRPHGRY